MPCDLCEFCRNPLRPEDRERMKAERDTILHTMARGIYFARFGNWGYDPGQPMHARYYTQASDALRELEAFRSV